MSYTNQVQILHLSDFHFGRNHICNPPNGGADAGITKLAQRISDDVNSHFGDTIGNLQEIMSAKQFDKHEPPLLLALTGDFTETAETEEFDHAHEFINTLTKQPILKRKITLKETFMIPGNHDVVFTKPTPKQRFEPYCTFYNSVFQGSRPVISSHDPLSITQVHTHTYKENKVLIAEINCCVYVERDTIEQSRGQVAYDAIEKLGDELKRLKVEKPDFDDYIKVALIHHHVVLLPTFIEGTKVDSVLNAGDLLELLSEYEFHAILHGHKHYPQIFAYDPLPSWVQNDNKIPQLVIAGGSCGSSELSADALNACNTYSLITIKWHPAAKQARIEIVTRGLTRRKAGGRLAPSQWHWSTINVTDKILTPYQSLPEVGPSSVYRWDSDDRLQIYKQLRLYMPVVEVMPSLMPGQAYEARAWIVEHHGSSSTQELSPSAGNKLARVEWSAGHWFEKQLCHVAENPTCCIAYQYWGPMLIEAKLIFEDGASANAYVYARLPGDESKSSAVTNLE